MIQTLERLFLKLADTLRVFEGNLSSPEGLDTLLFHYGWDIQLEPSNFERIHLAFRLAALPDLLTKVEALSNKSREDINPQEVLAIVQQLHAFISDLGKLGDAADAGLPFPFNQKSFWSEFGQRLLADVLVLFLQKHYPLSFSLLHLFGIIQFEEEEPESQGRLNNTRTVIYWDKLGDLITGPVALFKDTYQWGLPDKVFQWEKLLHALEYSLLANGFLVRYVLPRKSVVEEFSHPDYMVKYGLHELHFPFIYGVSIIDESFYNIGIAMMPIGRGNMDKAPEGLIITPILQGDLGLNFFIAPGIKLNLGADIFANGVLGVKLYPDSAELATNLPNTEFTAKISLDGAPQDPWIIFGSRDSHRLELHGFELYFQVSGQVSDPEVKIGLRTQSSAPKNKGVRAVIQMEESDNFLRETTQSEQLDAAFDVLLEWSNKTGFRVDGSLDFNLNFNLKQKLGPIEITQMSVALGDGPKNNTHKSIRFHTGLGFKGKVGPLLFAVEDIGFSMDFIPYTHEELRALPPGADPPMLGLLDLDFGFSPPKGIALGIESDLVTGGGYLFFNPDKGQYAGVLYLEIAHRIGVTAIGLLDTRMPDGKKGYSLLILITVDGFTPIQLGFGFMLEKVGGLLGIHRTVAEKVLRERLRAGNLNSVLFPVDPLANAARIVSDLQSIFPPAPDQYLFGPMFELSWGKPTMLRIQLGIVFEFPQAVRLHILGKFQAGLPSIEEPLVELNLDAYGLIDFGQGLIELDARLYNSNILKTIELSGDMALRARWKDDPMFILSIGGFHPKFKDIPTGFPALKRLTFSLSKTEEPPPPQLGMPQPDPPAASLELQAYFALTSNTVQVGARLDLYVSAFIFSIDGSLYFDALFQFDPFQFIIDFGGHVRLKVFGYDLLAIKLDITLSGPQPWHAMGTLTIEILWWDVELSFDRQLSEGEPPPAPPPYDPMPELVAALEDYRNWESGLPQRGGLQVSLRELPPVEGELLVHPQVLPGVRQRVLPLDKEITRFGAKRLASDTNFHLDMFFTGGAGIECESLVDEFAPAQFKEMSNDEKIKSPSFEKMNAGLRIAASEVTFGQALSSGIEYETCTLNEMDGKCVELKTTPLKTAKLDWQAPQGAAGQAAAQKNRYGGQAIDLRRNRPAYVLADTDNLTTLKDAAGAGKQEFNTYAGAQDALKLYEATDPGKKGKIKIMSSYLAN